MSADMLGFFVLWENPGFPRIQPDFARDRPKTEMDLSHFSFENRRDEQTKSR